MLRFLSLILKIQPENFLRFRPNSFICNYQEINIQFVSIFSGVHILLSFVVLLLQLGMCHFGSLNLFYAGNNNKEIGKLGVGKFYIRPMLFENVLIENTAINILETVLYFNNYEFKRLQQLVNKCLNLAVNLIDYTYVFVVLWCFSLFVHDCAIYSISNKL